jgi:hypothetical protein
MILSPFFLCSDKSTAFDGSQPTSILATICLYESGCSVAGHADSFRLFPEAVMI